MNEYVSDEIQKRWMNYSFIGKPFQIGDGKRYIRAYSKCFEQTHFYCFDTDFIWHDRPTMPKTDPSLDKL
jgi:hypothetical protein